MLPDGYLKQVMTDKVYQKFIIRAQEVMDLPVQRVGPLTPIYKLIVRHLKIMPWPLMLIVSTGTVFLLYLLVGVTVTLLVTILQRGF